MISFYIATSLSRAKDHNIVRDLLTNEGYKLTYDWTMHGSVKHVSKEKLSEVAARETAGVLAADVLIVLLPGGKGTHTEFGMALASGKPVVIHSEDSTHFELGDQTVAFYHHPNVQQINCSLQDPAPILHSLNEKFETFLCS